MQKIAVGLNFGGGKTVIIGDPRMDKSEELFRVTDMNQENVERAVRHFGASAVNIDEIYDVDCDIFSPCTLGAVINDNTIPQL